MNILLIVFALAGIAVVAAIFYAVKVASNKAQADAATRTMSMSFMNNCESRIRSLQADPANKNHAKPLAALQEQIRFSDKSGTSEIDWRIDATLARLEIALASSSDETHEPTENPNDVIEEVTALFTRRSEEMREAKRGSF